MKATTTPVTEAGARSRAIPFSSMRNRVHLAVTPQGQPVRPAIPLARQPEFESVSGPAATDAALRQTVQAVPNQLR